MTDFATTRAANRPAFADRERREVVIEHEPLRVLLEQAIDALLVAAGAERDRDQGLRLATLEQGRAVNAGQQVDFAVDLRGASCCRDRRDACRSRIRSRTIFASRSCQAFWNASIRRARPQPSDSGINLERSPATSQRPPHRPGRACLRVRLAVLQSVVEASLEAIVETIVRRRQKSIFFTPTLSISSCCMSHSSRM